MPQDSKEKLPPIIVSIIPDLVGEEGHIFPYHHSVSKAACLLGWEHQIALPKTPKIEDLPINCSPCLRHVDLESEANLIQKIARIKDSFALGFSIANYLEESILSKRNSTIVFLERFIHLQLLSLTIALLFLPKENLSVWLLYRRDTHNAKTGFIYKFFTKAIKKLLNPGKLQLLTDSEILSQSLSQYFAEPFTVMPIPHTEISCENKLIAKTTKITCWWAGPPRAEKGCKIIRSLVKTQSKFAKEICVVASESSKLIPITGGVNVKLIKDNLTRNEYDLWLCSCDFILLPYDSEAYRERTSGIFTECIIAGKIPLVTSQTWMAKELSKYNLEKLILDWQDLKKVLEIITQIKQDLTIKAKLNQMQRQYQQFHCLEKYAEKIGEIYKLSMLR